MANEFEFYTYDEEVIVNLGEDRVIVVDEEAEEYNGEVVIENHSLFSLEHTLGGKWKFNEAISPPEVLFEEQSIKFTISPEIEGISEYDTIFFPHPEGLVIENRNITPFHSYMIWHSGVWKYDIDYIDFGDAPQAVSEEFYDWFTANATSQDDIEITYNGSVIASLSAGQTATLLCNDKKMNSDVVVNSKDVSIDSYEQGYNDGYAKGYEIGFSEGETKGRSEGYNQGYNTGLAEGENIGYTKGYNEGYSVGYNEGFAKGKQEGYAEGYEQGKSEGGDTEAAYNEGVEAGKQAEKKAFSDEFQDFGNRTDYTYGLAGIGWNNETIKRLIYPITVKNGSYMFASAIFDNFDFVEEGVILDVSQATALTYMCNGTKGIKRFGSFDVLKCPNLNRLFYSCNVQIIDEFIVNENSTFTNVFDYANNLIKIIFKGIIAKNGLNLQWSKKLSKESIESIINCLSISTSGLTVTLSKDAVNKAFETSEGANDGSTSAEWLELIGTKTNWTISLV